MYPETKEFIRSIKWEQFEGGYGDSPETVASSLLALCDADDEDSVYSILYSDMISHLKYGFDVFPITAPVVDVFTQLNNEHFTHQAILLDFLGYIYATDIREAVPVLSYPVRYSFAKKDKTASPGFEAFRKFFRTYYHGTDNPELYKSDVYYTASLFPEKKEIGRIFELITDNNNDTTFIKNAVISAALINYLQKEKTALPANIATILAGDEELQPYVSVFKGFSGEAIENASLETLFSTYQDETLLWAQAFTSVIAADALLIGSLSDKQRVRNVLDEDIFPLLQEKKKQFEEEEQELDFPLYPFMAEDITSIIFRNFLNSGKALDLKDLDDLQRYCLEQLYAMKIHTHAMLHAGLLPEGITPSTQPVLLPIYNYTI